MKLKIHYGDIAQLKVDTIVNAAGITLWMGGGVSGAIKKKGGVEIEQEAVSKGPVTLGSVVVTKSGKLKCKHVLHAVAVDTMGNASDDSIKLATVNSMQKAFDLDAKSIAFPILGSGVGGYTIMRAMKIMYLAAKSTNNIDKVVFTIFEPDEELREAVSRFEATFG